MKKLVKVHRLPAEGGSIWMNKAGKLYSYKPKHFAEDWKSFNLYFTSDEEVKVGDWIIWKGELLKAKKQHCFVARKIVATTDKSLTKSSNWIKTDVQGHWKCTNCNSWTELKKDRSCKCKPLPQISQQSIEDYAKAGGIDEVYLEYEERLNIPCGFVGDYIIAPKTDQNNCVITRIVKPKLYTKEEVEILLIKALNHEGYNIEFGRVADNINWIKKNLRVN